MTTNQKHCGNHYLAVLRFKADIR